MHLEKKQRTKKQKILIATGFAVVALWAGYLAYQNGQPSDTNLKTLTTEQQTSLIQVNTELVKKNTKPKEVIAGLSPRISKLSESNKELATDLIYTSVQNAAFYYNTTGTVMSGELDYNRGSSKSALAGGAKSAWVSGFLRDIQDQALIPYSLSGAQILALPNWKLLYQEYRESASPELKILLETGRSVSDYPVFNGKDGSIDPLEANRAFERVLEGLSSLSAKNPQSKYLADLNSLARIYRDLALGSVYTENVTLNKDGQTYSVSKKQQEAYRTLAATSSDPVTKADAEGLLSLLQDGNLPGSSLKKVAETSQKRFGSNVFWQGETDLASIVNGQAVKDAR